MHIGKVVSERILGFDTLNVKCSQDGFGKWWLKQVSQLLVKGGDLGE